MNPNKVPSILISPISPKTSSNTSLEPSNLNGIAELLNQPRIVKQPQVHLRISNDFHTEEELDLLSPDSITLEDKGSKKSFKFLKGIKNLLIHKKL